MADNFNAEEFLDRMNEGAFDGRVHEELSSLSREQLEKLAFLMIKRLQGKATGAD